jgi:invasion protein IalB
MNESPSRALQYGLPAVLLLVGLLVGWIGHSLSNPPGAVPTVSLYGNWRLGCPALSDQKGSCTLQLPVVDSQSGATVANLLMGHSPSGIKLEVTLPLEVLIVPGMGMVVGSDKVRTYHYDTCMPQGCITSISVDDKLMDSLQKAQRVQLLFALPNSKKPYGISVELKGLADAHAAFLNNDGLRHSWWRRLLS